MSRIEPRHRLTLLAATFLLAVAGFAVAHHGTPTTRLAERDLASGMASGKRTYHPQT